MASRSRDKLKTEIMAVLQSLTEEERAIFSEVLKIESANLHLERPRVKDDIIQAVRRAIK